MRASNSVRITARFARGLAVLSIGLAMVGLSAPSTLAAGSLSLTTPYPGVAVSPGHKVGFDIAVKTSTAGRVNLAVSGAPTDWTATLTGGGNVVTAVETDGNTPTTVHLDVSVPSSATASAHLTVTATGLGQTATLGLDVNVETQAYGTVTFTTDVPSVQGSATSTFSFTLLISNNTPADLTFTANATGPAGWTVTAQLSSSSQAASAIVKAGTSTSVAVNATAPTGVAAGAYPINVVATSGSKQYQQQLTVNVIGSYTLTMSTPNQVLSAHGGSGSPTQQQLTLTNGGSADITNVQLSDTVPTNWKVSFDQPTVAKIPAGQSVTVTATITPSSDAIAGDYDLTFKAAGDQSTNATVDIRFTVETSILGAIAGIALIVAVFVGLWWVFRRYGRR